MHTIPGVAKAVLENSKRFKLLSLDPIQLPKKPTNGFHGWEVRGKLSIAPPDLKRIIDAFEQAVADEGAEPAWCFNPRQIIRVTSGGKSAHFVICFECNHVRVYVDEEAEKTILISNAPADLFNKVLREDRIKLPPD